MHKKTLSKDGAAAIVGEAIKSVSLGEKELLGAEKALNDFRDGVKKKLEDKKAQGSTAMEEEFVPVVSATYL